MRKTRPKTGLCLCRAPELAGAPMRNVLPADAELRDSAGASENVNPLPIACRQLVLPRGAIRGHKAEALTQNVWCVHELTVGAVAIDLDLP